MDHPLQSAKRRTAVRAEGFSLMHLDQPGGIPWCF